MCAGWSESKSKAHSASDFHSGLEMGGQESSQPLTGMSDLAESLTEGLDQNDVSQTEEEPDAEKENFPPLELTEDIIDSDRLSDATPEDTAPEEAAASDTAEQEEEEEWEDEEDEDSNGQSIFFTLFHKVFLC